MLFSVHFFLPHVLVVWGSMLLCVNLCLWRLFSRLLSRPSTCPLEPWPQFPLREYRDAQVDASPVCVVTVVHSAYSLIGSIPDRAQGVGIHCFKISIVVIYELDRVLKMRIVMMSSVTFAVVLISFLRMEICLVQYWATVWSGDGQEALNFQRA